MVTSRRTIKWAQAPHFVRDQYHRRNFVKHSLNYQRSRRTSLNWNTNWNEKKRDLEDGIWVTEDLIWEDREAKKKLKEVMTEAFKNGKKPRFTHGKLYIDVPLRDHITPHYANLGLIKLPDIVKLNTSQLIYDPFVDKKPPNFTLASVSEQQNYDTRSASLQHLNLSSFSKKFKKILSNSHRMLILE